MIECQISLSTFCISGDAFRQNIYFWEQTNATALRSLLSYVFIPFLLFAFTTFMINIVPFQQDILTPRLTCFEFNETALIAISTVHSFMLG